MLGFGFRLRDCRKKRLAGPEVILKNKCYHRSLRPLVSGSRMHCLVYGREIVVFMEKTRYYFHISPGLFARWN